jgi:hypothetical protein
LDLKLSTSAAESFAESRYFANSLENHFIIKALYFSGVQFDP